LSVQVDVTLVRANVVVVSVTIRAPVSEHDLGLRACDCRTLRWPRISIVASDDGRGPAPVGAGDGVTAGLGEHAATSSASRTARRRVRVMA
jgi:hypothetical protein